MIRYRYGTACLLCMLAGTLPHATFAQTTPSWVYDAVHHLEEEGYIDLGGREAASIPHDDLTKIVAQGLHEIDRIQQGTLADEYGRITSLAVRDEAHMKLYWEQERYALKGYEAAQTDARKAEELLARQSMRGENRLEVMQPLQERAAAASRRLQFAAREVHGTFFVITWNIHNNPNLLRAIAAEGNEIGSHTDGHKPMTIQDEKGRQIPVQNPEEYDEDVRSSYEKLAATVGDMKLPSGRYVLTRLLRPPRLPSVVWALRRF